MEKDEEFENLGSAGVMLKEHFWFGSMSIFEKSSSRLVSSRDSNDSSSVGSGISEVTVRFNLLLSNATLLHTGYF